MSPPYDSKGTIPQMVLLSVTDPLKYITLFYQDIQSKFNLIAIEFNFSNTVKLINCFA